MSNARIGAAAAIVLYIAFLLTPIYWLVNMSFKTTNEILGVFSLWPREFTFANYGKIFSDPAWRGGYFNSLAYALINTVLSVAIALPAAYAFSRYRFLGDKHLFFWLLTNRMAPPAVFALPFFQFVFGARACSIRTSRSLSPIFFLMFRSRFGFWRGFMSSTPKELDETAFIDGHSFPRFFIRIFMPSIASGIGVAGVFLFYVFVGRIAAGEDLDFGRGETHRGDDDAHGQRFGLRVGAFGRGRDFDDYPRRACDLVRAQLHRQGLRAGAGLMIDLSWMAWTRPTAIFFAVIFALVAAMGAWEWLRPGGAPRRGILGAVTTRGDRLFVSFAVAAFIHLGWLGLTDWPLWICHRRFDGIRGVCVSPRVAAFGRQPGLPAGENLEAVIRRWARRGGDAARGGECNHRRVVGAKGGIDGEQCRVFRGGRRRRFFAAKRRCGRRRRRPRLDARRRSESRRRARRRAYRKPRFAKTRRNRRGARAWSAALCGRGFWPLF